MKKRIILECLDSSDDKSETSTNQYLEDKDVDNQSCVDIIDDIDSSTDPNFTGTDLTEKIKIEFNDAAQLPTINPEMQLTENPPMILYPSMNGYDPYIPTSNEMGYLSLIVLLDKLVLQDMHSMKFFSGQGIATILDLISLLDSQPEQILARNFQRNAIFLYPNAHVLQ
jgi:hypothetical protein